MRSRRWCVRYARERPSLYGRGRAVVGRHVSEGGGVARIGSARSTVGRMNVVRARRSRSDVVLRRHPLSMAGARHCIGGLDVRCLRGTGVQHHSRADARRSHGIGKQHRAGQDVGGHVPRHFPARRNGRRSGVRIAGGSLRPEVDAGVHDSVLLDLFRAHVLCDRAVARRGAAVPGGARRRRRVGGGSDAGRRSLSGARSCTSIGNLSCHQRPRDVARGGCRPRRRQPMALRLHYWIAAGAAGVVGTQQHPRAGTLETGLPRRSSR